VRCLLLGFAPGIIALQQQALPPPPFFQWVAAPALAAGLAATWLSSLRPLRVGNVWIATLPLVALLAAGAAGFGYAAWRAEARLADALPSEWEGRDITVVGIVDDLPQPVDRERFAFFIERVETRGARVPSSVSLAWYAPISRDLVVPHHGSRSSSTQAFIDAVHPDTAVFTPGYRNRFGHPRPEVVDRYAQAGIARFRTDYDGAMIFDFGPNARGVHAQREREARYWRDVPVRAELPPLE
jgi:hypothetical protein